MRDAVFSRKRTDPDFSVFIGERLGRGTVLRILRVRADSLIIVREDISTNARNAPEDVLWINFLLNGFEFGIMISPEDGLPLWIFVRGLVNGQVLLC